MEALNGLNNWARLYLPSPISTLAITVGVLCLLATLRNRRASWGKLKPLLIGGSGLGLLVFGLLLHAAFLTSVNQEMKSILKQWHDQLNYFYSTPWRGLLSIVFVLAGCLCLLLATHIAMQFKVGFREMIAPHQTHTRLIVGMVGILLLAVGMFLAVAVSESTSFTAKSVGIFRQLDEFASNFIKTPFSIVTFMLGVYLLLVAGGIAIGFKIGDVSLPAPQTERGKLLVRTAGAALLALSVILALVEPTYKTTVTERLIYGGTDTRQVIADGDDVYLLHANGNIHRILEKTLELVDSGTDTRQVAPAGGVMYVLKEWNRKIWAISVASKSLQQKPTLREIDIGTIADTRQIATAGEILYFLTEGGKIYKYFVCPQESKQNLDCKRLDNVVLVDIGTNTKRIASAGSVLYVLKNDGSIWQYGASVAECPSDSRPANQDCFVKIYPVERDLPPPSGQEAEGISADGGTLYFWTRNGSVWRFRRGLALIKHSTSDTRKLDAIGGILYILTTEGEVWRYSAKTENLRQLVEAGKENRDIGAHGVELFATKLNGNVWRYSEVALGR